MGGGAITGIALALEDITKIALGSGEVLKVSLGDELIWPITVEVIHEYYTLLIQTVDGIDTTYYFGQNGTFGGPDPGTPEVSGVYAYDPFGAFSQYTNPPNWNLQLPNPAVSYEMYVTESGVPPGTGEWKDGEALTYPDVAPIRMVNSAVEGNCDLYVRNKLDQAIVKILHFGGPTGSPVFTPMSNALVYVSDNDSNTISTQLNFNSNGTTIPQGVGGTPVSSGVLNWYGGTPTPSPLSVRITRTATGSGTNEVKSSNGTSLTLNVWHNFIDIAGFYCKLTNTGSGSYNRTSSYTVEFSTNGGSSINSTSTFSIRTIKQ